MNRVNVKMNMDIISAFAEGKIIQYKDVCGGWNDLTEEEGLPMNTLNDEPNNFRIKPEPKYRPFANAEECWQEMQKHQSSGWVVKTERNMLSHIELLDFESKYKTIRINGNWFNMKEMLAHYTFPDGTPFGIKEIK